MADHEAPHLLVPLLDLTSAQILGVNGFGKWRLDYFGLRNPVYKFTVSPCAVLEIDAQFIGLLLVYEELRKKEEEWTVNG